MKKVHLTLLVACLTLLSIGQSLAESINRQDDFQSERPGRGEGRLLQDQSKSGNRGEHFKQWRQCVDQQIQYLDKL